MRIAPENFICLCVGLLLTACSRATTPAPESDVNERAGVLATTGDYGPDPQGEADVAALVNRNDFFATVGDQPYSKPALTKTSASITRTLSPTGAVAAPARPTSTASGRWATTTGNV